MYIRLSFVSISISFVIVCFVTYGSFWLVYSVCWKLIPVPHVRKGLVFDLFEIRQINYIVRGVFVSLFKNRKRL